MAEVVAYIYRKFAGVAEAAVENDLDGFAAFAANSAKPFSTV